MRTLLLILVLTGGLACEKTIKEAKAPAAPTAASMR
jgi:hypothetical protein